MKHPMVCVWAFSIEKAGKVVVAAEPGDEVMLERLPADARRRLCASGIIAAGPVSPVELPAEEQPHQHVLPSSVEPEDAAA